MNYNLVNSSKSTPSVTVWSKRISPPIFYKTEKVYLKIFHFPEFDSSDKCMIQSQRESAGTAPNLRLRNQRAVFVKLLEWWIRASARTKMEKRKEGGKVSAARPARHSGSWLSLPCTLTNCLIFAAEVEERTAKHRSKVPVPEIAFSKTEVHDKVRSRGSSYVPPRCHRRRVTSRSPPTKNTREPNQFIVNDSGLVSGFGSDKSGRPRWNQNLVVRVDFEFLDSDGPNFLTRVSHGKKQQPETSKELGRRKVQSRRQLQSNERRMTQIRPITNSKFTPVLSLKKHRGSNVVSSPSYGDIPRFEGSFVSEYPKSPKHPINNHIQKPSFFRALSPMISKLQNIFNGIERGQRYTTPITNPITHLYSKGTRHEDMICILQAATPPAISGGQGIPREERAALEAILPWAAFQTKPITLIGISFLHETACGDSLNIDWSTFILRASTV
ncbi:hypothetical protein LXL04_022473 [Taraxacum kok-saghyz]